MKLHLRTFGCRANHYDTERVRALALAHGHEIVDDVADADMAVINSCAVTSEAERDARRAVRSGVTRNPRVRSIVMGCASGLPSAAAALRQLPGVDAVIAGADMDALAAALGVETPSAGVAGTIRQQTARAMLRIQDGCDEHCTFCATTIARGANRSRALDDLTREAAVLADHHPEIVLTGTHIGTYGADTGSSLGALVETLIARVPVVRFRLSSVEATEVDSRLADLFRSDPSRLVPHLHAPLQSGSDRILRRMGRHWYSAERYARAVESLCAGRGVFGLGADVIVGFPGETDDDFAATVALVERLPFTYLHVFPYSARPGTAAPRLPDALASSVVQERAERLRRLSAEKGAAYARNRAGSAADLVVITSAPRREAMTEDFLTVTLLSPRPRGERFVAPLHWESGSLIAT